VAAKSKEELLIKINADLAELEKALDSADEQIKGKSASLKANMANVGKAMAVSFAAISAQAVIAIDRFKQFETGVTAVAKTTNLEGVELEKFKKGIIDLSEEIPVAKSELLDIATAAGQLGIKGVPELLKFTETVAKLGATTDLSGETAALAFGRILSITGESVTEIDKLGSVFVDLGNNFATTEAQIAVVASEVAKSTAVYNLNSAEIAGLSAALSSLGIRAELGGSSIGRSFRAIDTAIRDTTSKSFKQLEKLTGLVGEDLVKAFGEDAVGVFQRFIEGLGDINEQGGNVSETLAVFNLKGEEILKVLPTLAERSELVGEALERASKASKSAAALNDEAALAFDTTASKLQLAQNRLDTLFVQVGEELAPEMIQAVSDITTILIENKDVIIALTSAAVDFIRISIEAIQGFRTILLTLRGDEAKALIQSRVEVDAQNRFFRKKLEERGLSEADFAKKRKRINKKVTTDIKKIEEKSSDDIQKIDINKKKQREKIANATAEELKNIEERLAERTIEINANELELLQLRAEGASEETIELKRKEGETLRTINRLTNDIIELEQKDFLSSVESANLEHFRRLLEFRQNELDNQLRIQQEFGDDVVDDIERTFREIEQLEVPAVSIPVEIVQTVTTTTTTPTDGGDVGDTGTGGGDVGGPTTDPDIIQSEISGVSSATAGGLSCAAGWSARQQGPNVWRCVRNCPSGSTRQGFRDCVRRSTSVSSGPPIRQVFDGITEEFPFLETEGTESTIIPDESTQIQDQQPAVSERGPQRVIVDIRLNEDAASVISAQQREQTDLNISTQ